jgi:CelD/BcsL family acetyltransferase involved in cellulose biosynthesis
MYMRCAGEMTLDAALLIPSGAGVGKYAKRSHVGFTRSFLTAAAEIERDRHGLTKDAAVEKVLNRQSFPIGVNATGVSDDTLKRWMSPRRKKSKG